LSRAFLPDARARRRTGTTRPPSPSGWWRRHEARTETDAGDHDYPNEAVAAPPSHRAFAALIPQQPAHSIRREELVALLRDEMWARPVEETRAM
jgi:hypothetical protein